MHCSMNYVSETLASLLGTGLITKTPHGMQVIRTDNNNNLERCMWLMLVPHQWSTGSSVGKHLLKFTSLPHL